MSKPGKYTVGWICAISTEYVAAQAFLDEKHDAPEYVSTNDNNDYTLGRVGKHNVVIAVLPNGEYGTASAAMVARDMLHSFPNIRIGLMVGIGGGAPSKEHDIRLGDIVVSASHNKEGGVFQYDYGKTVQNRGFQYIQFLNQPPTILRTAMNGLKAQYESDGHKFEEAISTILDKKPKLRQKYKRPDPSSDRLYKSGVVHPIEDGDCAVVCGDDPSSLLLRPKRTEIEGSLVIHYGLIASANQLMKDALVRDKLIAEKGVLCFEMEAAGLMNHFPCLVIRGICDYSDSHNNKEWQGYAAMAAAAYAKDLLNRISPSKIEAERNVNEKLSEILTTTSGLKTNIEKINFKLDTEQNTTILNWLSQIDYGPQQIDYINRRQRGTGQWLLDSNNFREFTATSGQTLFCQGIPGAGKTILTAIVVDHLCNIFKNDSTVRIAYIYCDFRRKDEQTADDLLLSLLKQLAKSCPSLPQSVKGLYDLYNEQKRPDLEEVSNVILSIIAMYSKVFFIIDALDECQDPGGCPEKFLSQLFNLQTTGAVNIFATSRFIPQIASKFDGRMSLEIRASKEDIKSYLESRIGALHSFIREDRQLQEEIKMEISQAADGVFLLAKIYLKSLDDKLTKNDIRNALKRLHKQAQSSGGDKVSAVSAAYDQAMDRINGQQVGFKELAAKVLLWITCSKRPLTTSELQCALAVKNGKSKLDQGDLPDLGVMVSVCAGLVTVDNESGIIRLVHHTAQEYFEQKHKDLFPDAEIYIAQICITYLSFSVFASGFCRSDVEFEERLRSNRLYHYAARNWGHHAREVSASLLDAKHFLEDEAKVESASQALMAVKRWKGYSQEVPRKLTGLHLAAFFGVENMVRLYSSSSLDLKDSNNRTPLWWAAANGHEAVVQLLLNEGADINSKDDDGNTPLSQAANNGHETVLRLMVDKCADIDSKDMKRVLRAVKSRYAPIMRRFTKSKDKGQISLSRATRNGHEAVDKIADIELKNKSGDTPLSQAACKGHEGIVQLLVNKGANIESRNNNGNTPLLIAAYNGHEAIVRLLINMGVDIEPINNTGVSPLLITAYNGHEAIVQLLANKGTNINLQENNGNTPLIMAAYNGHEAITQLLIDKGANIELKNNNGTSPLLQAVYNSHEAIVKLLVNKDANIESKNNNGNTPLFIAAYNGHKAIVQLLIDKGANIESMNNSGITPLSQAAYNGHEAIVQLLVNEGANIESISNNRDTPLLMAAHNGHKAIVQLLIDKGANIESMNNSSITPLLQAAWKGHEAIIQLLVNAGADIEIRDNNSNTPLLIAAYNGYEAIVKLLVNKGANIESMNNSGISPLLIAAHNGHEAIVRLLVDKAADVESKAMI